MTVLWTGLLESWEPPVGAAAFRNNPARVNNNLFTVIPLTRRCAMCLGMIKSLPEVNGRERVERVRESERG